MNEFGDLTAAPIEEQSSTCCVCVWSSGQCFMRQEAGQTLFSVCAGLIVGVEPRYNLINTAMLVHLIASRGPASLELKRRRVAAHAVGRKAEQPLHVRNRAARRRLDNKHAAAVAATASNSHSDRMWRENGACSVGGGGRPLHQTKEGRGVEGGMRRD